MFKHGENLKLLYLTITLLCQSCPHFSGVCTNPIQLMQGACQPYQIDFVIVLKHFLQITKFILQLPFHTATFVPFFLWQQARNSASSAIFFLFRQKARNLLILIHNENASIKNIRFFRNFQYSGHPRPVVRHSGSLGGFRTY